MLHHKLMSVQAATVGLQRHTERALCQPVGDLVVEQLCSCVCVGRGGAECCAFTWPTLLPWRILKVSGKKPSFLNSFTIRTHLFWRQDTHWQEMRPKSPVHLRRRQQQQQQRGLASAVGTAPMQASLSPVHAPSSSEELRVYRADRIGSCKRSWKYLEKILKSFWKCLESISLE